MIRMEDTRKRYEITCPYCGKLQYACKSIFHEMGIEDGGRGTCLECKKVMRLIFCNEKQEMRAEKGGEVDMEIDEMIEELLGMDIVKADDTVLFSKESIDLIHKIAVKCNTIPIVDETKNQAEEYARGLSAEQVYTDMLYKIVEAPTRIHMRVSARMLIPIIDQKLRDAETEG